MDGETAVVTACVPGFTGQLHILAVNSDSSGAAFFLDLTEAGEMTLKSISVWHHTSAKAGG